MQNAVRKKEPGVGGAAVGRRVVVDGAEVDERFGNLSGNFKVRGLVSFLVSQKRKMMKKMSPTVQVKPS